MRTCWWKISRFFLYFEWSSWYSINPSFFTMRPSFLFPFIVSSLFVIKSSHSDFFSFSKKYPNWLVRGIYKETSQAPSKLNTQASDTFPAWGLNPSAEAVDAPRHPDKERAINIYDVLSFLLHRTRAAEVRRNLLHENKLISRFDSIITNGTSKRKTVLTADSFPRTLLYRLTGSPPGGSIWKCSNAARMAASFSGGPCGKTELGYLGR